MAMEDISMIRGIIMEMDGRAEILAASKSRSAEEMVLAYGAGIRLFGENYVKEAAGKIDAVRKACPEARFHLIGHLQSNKVRKAIAVFDMIQSIDSLKTARMIDSECRKIGKIMPVLIEVNLGEEESKSGCRKAELDGIIEDISCLKGISMEGLMCIPPESDDADGQRRYFREMKTLFDRAKERYPNIHILSMGMSNDYKTALSEGSNMVRLGTAIFGPRRQN